MLNNKTFILPQKLKRNYFTTVRTLGKPTVLSTSLPACTSAQNLVSIKQHMAILQRVTYGGID